LYLLDDGIRNIPLLEVPLGRDLGEEIFQEVLLKGSEIAIFIDTYGYSRFNTYCKHITKHLKERGNRYLSDIHPR